MDFEEWVRAWEEVEDFHEPANYEDGLRRKPEISNEQEEIQLERESQI